MKTEKNILIAFLLNMAFSIFELAGGMITGSVAIVSDAIHDMGDAASIGISYLLEKKSARQPDDAYTYGYVRYSVLGGMITTVILLVSSVVVIGNAVVRLFAPMPIHYDGMIVFGVVGVIVNSSAALLFGEGKSLNQKAVRLHMLEDVLGWVVVLIGAVVMRFTDFALLDPLMSIGVAAFILIHTLKNLKEVMNLFLEKTPNGMDVQEIKEHICAVDGVLDVHHIHIRSLDGQRNCATMHIVTNEDAHQMKHAVRAELEKLGIDHATLELETEGEHCHGSQCHIEATPAGAHHHHHH